MNFHSKIIKDGAEFNFSNRIFSEIIKNLTLHFIELRFKSAQI